MSAFVPSGVQAEDRAVRNDGWYPDLSTMQMQSETGMGGTFGVDRLVAAIRSAMIEVNIVVADWRAKQTTASLAEASARRYGDSPEKVVLYRMAVYARARAQLLSVVRDYDSTKDGHAKADALELTADDWLAQSNEAIARMIGRSRTVVELI